MDWNLAIERNREALKRILAMLVAMTELRGQFTFFPQEGALPQGLAPAEKSKLSPALTLPRYLHTAVLRLLRPAEFAVRRLVIVAARGIVVAPRSSSRSRKAKPAPTILRSGVGTSILMPPARPGTVYFFPRKGAVGSGPDISGKKVNCPLRSTARPPALPLFDRLPRWETRPRRPIATSVPRISVPGITTRLPIVPRRLPAPGDPVDATRIGLRFAALASALDDLPRQAKRFARWRARNDAIRAQERNPDAAAQAGHLPQVRRRSHRNWPLKPGRPPGWQRRSRDELHEILKDLHGLAFDVLERRDTS